MRVSRVALAPVAGLVVGLASALLAAVWLRAAVPQAGLVWNVVGPGAVALWLVAMAHGVPLDLATTAGLEATDASGVERFGELLGGGAEATFAFSVLVVPIALLLVVGATTALVVRALAPRTSSELARAVAASAVAHGLGLAAIAWWGGVRLSFSGTLATELGFGAATGTVAVSLGPPVWVAGIVGAVWGAAFGASGGLAARRMRDLLDAGTRILLRGWLRGLGAAVGVAAVLLAVGLGVAAVITGDVAALGLGAWLLWANVVAAVLLVSHGIPIAVALDAGPFTGWERVALWGFGVTGGAAPAAAWLALLLPVVGGLVAGRFVARRTAMTTSRIGLSFGALWGLTLAVLALLLRVRVLSSFSVGDLSLGGGTAAADPLVALILGFVWGAGSGGLGAWLVRRRADEPAVAVG